MLNAPEVDWDCHCEYQWLHSVAFRSSSEAAARYKAVCPYAKWPQIVLYFLCLNFPFCFVVFFLPLLPAITSAHTGPAPSCSSPVCLWDPLFLVSDRLQFHHLEYFAYPKVIYLASSVFQSTRQELQSKTSPWAAQTVAAASLVGPVASVCMHVCEKACVGVSTYMVVHLTHWLGGLSAPCMLLNQLFVTSGDFCLGDENDLEIICKIIRKCSH